MKIMLKRMLIALGTGLLLALITIFFTQNGQTGVWNIFGARFWFMATPLLVMAFFVDIAGVITVHPVFGFKMFPWRGFAIGVLIALPASIGVFATPSAWGTFLIILAINGVYGLIIDVTATLLAGQGKQLLHENNE